MIKFTFALYKKGKLIGYENHAVDPNLGVGIGIYHNPIDSDLKAGNPITMGDKYYIFHDEKKLTMEGK